MAEDRSYDDDRSQPLDVALDVSKLVPSLREAGLDLDKLDFDEVLRSASRSDRQVRELSSRLERARDVDWEVSVVITVRY